MKSCVARKSITAAAEGNCPPKNFFVQGVFLVEAREDVARELLSQAVALANFCAEGQRDERVDKFYKRLLAEMIFFKAVKQIHQDNRSVAGFEQIDQLIKFFVERRKIFKLGLVAEDATAEKFCIAEHVLQAGRGVERIIFEIIFEREVKIIRAELFLFVLHDGVRVAFAYQILHDEISHVF